MNWIPFDPNALPNPREHGKLLVTNNLAATDAHGHKSHLWIVDMVHRDPDDDRYGIFAFTGSGRREPSFLTHYIPVEALLVNDPEPPNTVDDPPATVEEAEWHAAKELDELHHPSVERYVCNDCHRVWEGVGVPNTCPECLSENTTQLLENDPSDALVVFRVRQWIAKWITNRDKTDPWYFAAEELDRTLFKPTRTEPPLAKTSRGHETWCATERSINSGPVCDCKPQAASVSALVERLESMAVELRKLDDKLTCVETRAVHPNCDFCGESLGLPERAITRAATKLMLETAVAIAALSPTPAAVEDTPGPGDPILDRPTPAGPWTRATTDVLAEREKQDRKWGEQNHDPFTYLTVLVEEVGEFAQAALHLRFGGHAADGFRKEAVQTAAVALAIVECIDRGKWTFRTDVDNSGMPLPAAPERTPR